jgi:hypothetical protein
MMECSIRPEWWEFLALGVETAESKAMERLCLIFEKSQSRALLRVINLQLPLFEDR